MAEFVLQVNGSEYKVEADPVTPLLWVIRDYLNLTGTKFGCGMAQCGACTIHLDGNAVRSCVLPVSAATNKSITTIEGLSKDNNHPLQQAWIKHQVPQCGYCQSGQIMSAAALLEKKSSPTEDDINSAMRGNICRCGTYGRIKAAIVEAAKMKNNGNK
jgi:isoquinoline 1-oxidoreductase subunit alpha